MPAFLSIDELEQVSQETLLVVDVRVEIQQRLQEFCDRLEPIKQKFETKGLAENDPQAKATYEQVLMALRHYRSQLQTDLPELSRRLLEARQSLEDNGESNNGIDLIKQIIEERREEQAKREYEAQLSRQQSEKLTQDRHDVANQLLERIAEQEDYYDASFLAMDVYHYREELKGVDRLDEVVEALFKKVQEVSDKPISLYGTGIQKLKIMDAHARKLWAQVQTEPRPVPEKKPKAVLIDPEAQEKEETQMSFCC